LLHSALHSRPALRNWLLLLFLVLLTEPAFADSVTIGTATYIGNGSWGHPSKTMLAVYLDTRGLIFDSYVPSLPYSLLFDVDVYGWTGWMATQSVNIVLTSQPAPTPEPSSLFLFGSGAIGIAAAMWRRRHG
jgi:hypothetical protein